MTFNSLNYRTKFTWWNAWVPMQIAVRTLNNIYFEILFNLSPHGDWFNIPPMKRVMVKANDLCLIFTTTDPKVPVPWQLVREWAEAMERLTDMGGLIGSYVASFERRVGENVIDFWVYLGIGTPPALAATAAK
ncbi:MAG: hypothetical protein Q9201_004087 [Fulgogasparrea decipioides]